MSGISRPTQPLYVIFDDTATEDHCDGQPDVLRHDHILPVAPGDRGYTGAPGRSNLLVEATPAVSPLPHTRSQRRPRCARPSPPGLIDLTSTLAPGGPVNMVAPVIGGS
jgi:hypothetical protein